MFVEWYKKNFQLLYFGRIIDSVFRGFLKSFSSYLVLGKIFLEQGLTKKIEKKIFGQFSRAYFSLVIEFSFQITSLP